MIPLTPELENKIKASGGNIHYVTLEEFQQILSKGTLLSKEEGLKQLGKSK